MFRASAGNEHGGRGQHTYLAYIVPGLEAVARQELASLGGVAVLRVRERIDQRTDLIVFRTADPPATLLELRTVEDLFILAAEDTSVPTNRLGLAAIGAAIARSQSLAPAVAVALAVRPRRKGRVTFRVIARKAGDHAFRRVDLQRAAEHAILDRFPNWRLVEDDARLELWLQLAGRQFLAGFRLSTNAMRQRDYLRVSLPAALKPTVAAAMVLLSGPEAGDVFLDPMCGSGTILIERALAGRYRLLLGGDSDPAAVHATEENIGRRYKPVEIRRWDARALPLADASVTAIVSNLPFGRQIGTPEGNRSLYPALLAEWTRVVRPGGRMVLLTGDRALLRRSIQRHRELIVRRELPVLVRGFSAAIVTLDRVAVSPDRIPAT